VQSQGKWKIVFDRWPNNIVTSGRQTQNTSKRNAKEITGKFNCDECNSRWNERLKVHVQVNIHFLWSVFTALNLLDFFGRSTIFYFLHILYWDAIKNERLLFRPPLSAIFLLLNLVVVVRELLLYYWSYFHLVLLLLPTGYFHKYSLDSCCNIIHLLVVERMWSPVPDARSIPGVIKQV